MRWGRGPCNEGNEFLGSQPGLLWAQIGGSSSPSPTPPWGDPELARAPMSDLISQMLRFQGQDLGAH